MILCSLIFSDGVCAERALGGNSQAAPKRWGSSAYIALLAVSVAILFVWSSVALHAALPQASSSASGRSGQAISPANRPNAAPGETHPPGSYPSPALNYRAVLDKYCVTCHNEQLHTAGLVLSKVDVANVPEGAEVWEKVVAKLRAGAMPPPDMPRPDQATYDSFSAYLETALDGAAVAKPNPGRPAIHRLNRTEYGNAVRDLLAIEVNADSLLPVDDSGYGFDNIADVLSVSPSLLERYLSAAGKVTRLAIGDPTMHPALAEYSVPPFLLQNARMSEDLPFGSRGGIAIRHYFPVDGEYVLKIRLQRSGEFHDGNIIGLAQPHQLEVLLEDERIKLFTVGGRHNDKSKSGSTPSPEAIAQKDGAAEKDSKANKDSKVDKDPYNTTLDVGDAALQFRFPAKAGPRLVGVTFLAEESEPEGALKSRDAQFRFIDQSSGGRAHTEREMLMLPAVDKVTIEGPYNVEGLGDTPSRRRIFICKPTGSDDEIPCARKILSTLARRAYRRPVTDREVQALLGLYKVGQSEGGFEAGIRMVLEGILVSPAFIFRTETDPPNLAPGTTYRISDPELASRLSFFLWSSIPDNQLLDIAAKGKLKDPAVLEQQVRRMLADPRSEALVSNFGGQWLYLRNLKKLLPDLQAFPEFDENLREAFQQETELFLKSNLREDRSVLNLLDADYTFLNERLARFYGIPNVYGSRFRRLTLTGHEERRGLLGEGSILTVTSYANRTSPTVRGKWLLENILGSPPPPPPPNVPSLKEIPVNGKVLTMRERMEQHRANPACAVCHVRMDPLGFSLENFDGIGKWRTSEGDTPIDPSGVLPGGIKFQGPDGLRKFLLSHPEQFATAVTEKLLTYAIGRGVEYYDKPTIRKIARQAAPNDYRWSSLILGIVKSVPFQMRITRPQDPGTVKTIVSQNQ